MNESEHKFRTTNDHGFEADRGGLNNLEEANCGRDMFLCAVDVL